MNEQPGVLLAMLVRDLLNQPEGEVVILGRDNMDRENFTALQIVIDSLSPALRLNSSQKYDGDAEEMTYSQTWRQQFTINFYGDGAWSELLKFSLLLKSQKAYELQRDSGVDVLLTSSATDVKLLTGEQYSERYEVECNVMFTAAIAEEVLRIDTAQTEITEG